MPYKPMYIPIPRRDPACTTRPVVLVPNFRTFSNHGSNHHPARCLTDPYGVDSMDRVAVARVMHRPLASLVLDALHGVPRVGYVGDLGRADKMVMKHGD